MGEIVSRGGAGPTGIGQQLAVEAMSDKEQKEAAAKHRRASEKESLEMKLAGMQGISQIAAQQKADQQAALTLALTSDIGAGSIDKIGQGISKIA